MIDSHCHLLPGIDDGPPDEGVALEMAAVAVADGIDTVIVTPHMREGDYPNERDDVLAAVERFRAALQRAGIGLGIEPGSEIHLTSNMVERIKSNVFLTYADGKRYMLLECPYRTRPVGLEHVIFELRVAGITPVIAHPERTNFFIEEPDQFEEIVRLGALGQMTASSLTGRFGKQIRTLSEDWVRRRLVHILASDAHDPSYRPPKLSDARRRWAELDGEEHARLATEDYPAALISGSSIAPDPPQQATRRGGLLSRLFFRDR